MRRLLSIERIAGETALCEDDEGKRVRLPRASLPDGAGEGDLLRPVPGGWEIDREETARRRGAAAERLSRMSARTRRTNLETALQLASEPVSASTLAERFHVSRQIIVGDIALLRAGGAPVVATPRGYLLEGRGEAPERLYTIAWPPHHAGIAAAGALPCGRSGSGGGGCDGGTSGLRAAHRAA